MVVTMAHGSGGKETAELIQRVFRDEIGNEYLNCGEDGAVLPVSGRIAYATDSFVVAPVFFPGGDIGRLCVCGTVNDLAMMGARPTALTLGFIIEEGMEMADLSRIARSIAATCREAGVFVAAADTKVVEGSGGIYINSSGIGVIDEGREVRANGCRAGDALIVSGNLGDHHACILSHRMGIENSIQSDVAPLNGRVQALFDAGVQPHGMRDITRGGLATVANELADASGCRFYLEQEKAPVGAETAALCGILGLDPFYMGNEGKFLLAVDGKDAQRALQVLQGFDAAACVIGEVREGEGVTVRGRFGGERILPILYGEGLPRIC